MAIYLKTAEPQKFLNLHDAFAQQPRETMIALFEGVCELFACQHQDHRLYLLGSLRALITFVTIFGPALTAIELEADKWKATPKERRIIDAAHSGKYDKDVIEAFFYDYGGPPGLVGLIQAFRATDSILVQWQAIESIPAKQWLVTIVSRLFDTKRHIWAKFSPDEGGVIHAISVSKLEYLGKRKRTTKESSCHSHFVNYEVQPIPSPPIYIPDLPPINTDSKNMSISSLCNSPDQTPIEPSRTITFRSLDSHIRDLATLLTLLDEANIPTIMLNRVAKEKAYSNALGEEETLPALASLPLFLWSQELPNALATLESLAFVQKPENEFVSVVPELRSLVKSNTTGDAMDRMKYAAVMLVFHSFPVDPDADFYDSSLGISYTQLPHLVRVLKYLEDPVFVRKFPQHMREYFITSCLSASRCPGLGSKMKFVNTAQGISNASYVDPIFIARLHLRYKQLSRLYPKENIIAIPPVLTLNLATKLAYKAEAGLLNAQIEIYRDNLSGAWHMLENIDFSSRPDQLHLLQRKTVLKAKILRFAGDFPAAKVLMHTLEGILCNSTVPYYAYESALVLCESGLEGTKSALQIIPQCDYSSLGLGSVLRRPSHAAAGARLMQGLWMLKDNQFQAAQASFQEAKAIYVTLDNVYFNDQNPGLISSIRQFSVSAGLAMIAHAEWRLGVPVSLPTLLKFWQTALKHGRISRENTGGTDFPEMIISYTMCDVTYSMGQYDKTTELLEKAKTLYPATGRQFHFVALGSVWFDLVTKWNTENGLSQISPLDYEGYLTRQRKSGFPQVYPSTRLCE